MRPRDQHSLLKFQSGGHPTPVLDIRGAARLWACLPGARASAFRSTLADTWIRVFGGDETLIDEIARNREIQTQLPPNHPGRAFGQAVDERNEGLSNQSLSIPADIQTIVQTALVPFIQRLEGERQALQNALEIERTARAAALQPLLDRIQLESTARMELEARLQANALQCATLTQDLANAQEESRQLANRLADDVAGIRTAQFVEYRAQAFDGVDTIENFVTSPMTTSVRFKDLFRFMGIVGVKEEMSMACGRTTHRLAPGIGYRKQRGRDGREYVTIDYRKSQAPVMLRGIQATCAELGHVFETEDGEMCICGRVRELMRAIRQ